MRTVSSPGNVLFIDLGASNLVCSQCRNLSRLYAYDMFIFLCVYYSPIESFLTKIFTEYLSYTRHCVLGKQRTETEEKFTTQGSEEYRERTLHRLHPICGKGTEAWLPGGRDFESSGSQPHRR